MTRDPLLSDDLAELLSSFPNEALRDLVAILKQHTSYTPFTARRAYAAHALPPTGDFRPHAAAVAAEVLWWGSHDIRGWFADPPGWVQVLIGTAEQLSVPERERLPALPAWKIEGAIFRKAMEAWERLPPDKRKAAMKEAAIDADAARGGWSRQPVAWRASVHDSCSASLLRAVLAPRFHLSARC